MSFFFLYCKWCVAGHVLMAINERFHLWSGWAQLYSTDEIFLLITDGDKFSREESSLQFLK